VSNPQKAPTDDLSQVPALARSPFESVICCQEQLYLGGWEVHALLSDLSEKILSIDDNPAAVLEAVAILRVLREEHDPSIVDRLFDVIDEYLNNPLDIWTTDAGITVILEILDIIVAFKRPNDIGPLLRMMSWDIFQIPSHILLLVRRYGWRELWDAIVGVFDLRDEYDQFIRAQHALTGRMLEDARPGDPIAPESIRMELAALRVTASAATKPVLYVEGKTDRIILETAYRKLFPDKDATFLIRECDVSPNSLGGTGGAGTLARLIGSTRPDSAHSALALFDRDKEGRDAYKHLPSYFMDRPEPNYQPGRIAQGGRAAALLLPIPPGREKYAELLNLPIEFLFEDAALERKTASGSGLEFRYPQLETRVKRHGSPVVQVTTSTLPETREIVAGKMTFAEEIVPTLPVEFFGAFQSLFWHVQDMLVVELGSSKSAD